MKDTFVVLSRAFKKNWLPVCMFLVLLITVLAKFPFASPAYASEQIATVSFNMDYIESDDVENLVQQDYSVANGISSVIPMVSEPINFSSRSKLRYSYTITNTTQNTIIGYLSINKTNIYNMRFTCLDQDTENEFQDCKQIEIPAEGTCSFEIFIQVDNLAKNASLDDCFDLRLSEI